MNNMNNSVIKNKKKNRSSALYFVYGFGALIFWLAVWHAVSVAINAEVLLPTPLTVLQRLLVLVQTKVFIKSTLSSIGRIMLGYLCAVAAGFFVAGLIYKSHIADIILSPMLRIITATPIASFIILALVWIGKEKVPTFISSLIVLPVMASHVGVSLRSIDPSLREMCSSYSFSPLRKFQLLYLPSAAPEIAAGLATSLGLAWKSGVSAEVLCIPRNSIGRYVYESKVYLETADLFAWTATVIVLSMLIEKLLRVTLSNVTNRFTLTVENIELPIEEVKIKDGKEDREYGQINSHIILPRQLDSDIFIEKLSKSFDGKAVLKDFTLEIPAHKVTALSGPSGCGKTTLLRVLCGTEKADSGKINGIPAGSCATVFQEPRLLPWLSSIENVACVSPDYKLYNKKEAYKQAKKLLSESGMPEYTHSFVPANLSGGMCQRVAIARALISNRPLILLDEPFRGLDKELKEKIMKLVLENSDTVLLITHSPEEALMLGGNLYHFDALSNQ